MDPKTALHGGTAALVGLLLIAGCTATHHNPTPRPSQPPATAVSYTTRDLDGLTLAYPSTWRYIPYRAEVPSLGPAWTIGYISNGPITEPTCTTNSRTRVISCGGPPSRLAPGQVLVTVYGGEFAVTNPTTTFAGQPGQIDAVDTTRSCGPGADYAFEESTTATHRSGTAGSLSVLACSASTTSAVRAAVLRIFLTATYRALD